MKIFTLHRKVASFDASLQDRKKKLESALYLQKFMAEYRELKSWVLDVLNRVQQQPEPQSVAESETALNLHQERRTEIDGKAHRFASFQAMGRELNERARTSSGTSTLPGGDSSQKEIPRLLRELADGHTELLQRCDEKKRALREAGEWQELREGWKQLEAWVGNVEAGLRAEETGDSVQAVKTLLQKQDAVEQAVRLRVGDGGAFQVSLHSSFLLASLVQSLLLAGDRDKGG
jgi:hypothetical protein